MNKKTFHKRIIEEDDYDSADREDDPKNLLQNIRRKLESSAALNGGFDRLLFKIDSIEKNQIQIGEKVDKIHEAIYNPDDGLFSRIAANKASQIEAVTKIEKQLIEFSSWKQQYDEDGENCEKEADELQLKIQKLENSVSDVEKFQNTLFSGLKWLGAAFGGGVVAMLLKLFFNAIKNMP